WQTEHSLVIRSASSSSQVERRYRRLTGTRHGAAPVAMDNANSAATEAGVQRPDGASTVLYASLKAIHLLAIIAWVGGMAFTLLCLRPAAAVLEPPARVTLMHAAMGRFIALVTVAALVAFVTGASMVGIAWS